MRRMRRGRQHCELEYRVRGMVLNDETDTTRRRRGMCRYIRNSASPFLADTLFQIGRSLISKGADVSQPLLFPTTPQLYLLFPLITLSCSVAVSPSKHHSTKMLT